MFHTFREIIENSSKTAVKRKVVYTANFGSYDYAFPSADFYFNEDNNPFDGCAGELSDRLRAKLYKVINPFLYDVWIDSSIEFVDRDGFEELLSGDLCVARHPFHNTLYEELEACYKLGYVNEKQAENIKFLYKSIGMSLENTPVYSCGIIYRTKKAISANNLWWKLICQYSFRDQLTFPFVVLTTKGINFKVLDIDIFDNKYLVVNNHKSGCR